MFKTSVESTNVKWVGWNDQTLHVSFVSGKLYLYRKVPLEVYDRLICAPSVGKFLNAEVKGKYEYSEVPAGDGSGVEPQTPDPGHVDSKGNGS